MSQQTEALKLALEALKQIDEAMPFPVAKFAQAAIREALAEHSAQRTWVGLTEEEIEKLKHLVDWTASWSHGRFAYELEAKLKEKNA